MHCINLGGTAEVYYSFCPCMGTEAFFTLALRPARENDGIAMEELVHPSLSHHFLSYGESRDRDEAERNRGAGGKEGERRDRCRRPWRAK